MSRINYTDIFEGSLNEIYVFSATTLYFLEVNRGARENLGYTMEELRQLTPLDLKLDYTLKIFAQLIQPLRDGTREKLVFETKHYRKDGTFYPVEVHLHRSKIGDEHVFVAIILDITERIEAEKRALQLAMEQERIQLLQEFIGDVSHDLRTPLTQASTSLYLLSRHTHDPQHHTYIQRIEQALARVQRMIDSMLQMNELDLQDNYDKEITDLNALVDAVVHANLEIACQRKLQLTFVPGFAGSLLTFADVHYLQRAIENILINALTYTNAGGSIIVQTHANAGSNCIAVRDTGTGIHPDHLPHIFERFYRGDSARNTTDGSNGMGLAITKKIVEEHGGSVEVETQWGKGTTFFVHLPSVSQEHHGE